MTLNEFICSHPIIRMEKDVRKRQIWIRFSKWLSDDIPDDWLLSLYPFVNILQLAYFNEEVVDKTLVLFSERPTDTLDVLKELSGEISHAMHTLMTPGPSWGKEEIPSLSSPNDFVEFDQLWHPEYQRYCEHAFNHCINIPLAVLGKKRSKHYHAQTLTNRVKMLDDLGYKEVTEGFNSVIRNSISHGKIEFTPFVIRYIDQREMKEYSPTEFLGYLDSLTSTSTAVILSILLFMAHHSSQAEAFGLNHLPIGIMLYVLYGAATHKDFHLRRLLVNEVMGGRKQLNFICSTELKSGMAHQLAALHLCVKAQDFGAGEFGRLSVSIDIGQSIPNVIFFNGDRLREARVKNEPLEVLGDVIESSLLWHNVSSIRRRIETYNLTFKIALATYWSNLRERWAAQDITPIRFRYIIRNVRNVSAGKIRRLDATVIVNFGETISKGHLLRIARHSIRRLKRQCVHSIDLRGESFAVRRPSYVWVRIFKKDGVLRHLHRIDAGGNLLLKAEWTSFFHRNKPLFVRFPTDIAGGYRFEYPVRTMEENLAIIQELNKKKENSEQCHPADPE